MATQFFGVNRGERLSSVATGTSTTGKSLEVAISDAAGWTRAEIDIALSEILLRFIREQRSTPFTQ